MSTSSVNYFTAFTSLSIITAIPAILGNALCLLIYIKTPNFHSPSNVLLCALCISDLIVGLVAQPLSIATTIAIESGYVFENLWRSAGVVITSLSNVSCLLTLLVTTDRYLAICHPLRYYEFATAKKYKILAIIAFTVSTPMGPICFLLQLNIFPYLAAVQFLVICLMLFIYAKIYRAIIYQRKSVASIKCIGSRKSDVAVYHKREKNKAHMIMIILLVFIICYFPMSAVYSFMTSRNVHPCSNSKGTLIAATWGTFFVMMNSSINPFVYWLVFKDVKKAIRHQFDNSSLFWRTCHR